MSVLLRRKKENIHSATYKYHVKSLDNISSGLKEGKRHRALNAMAYMEGTVEESMPKDHRLSAGQGQVERFYPSTSCMGNFPTRCCSKEM